LDISRWSDDNESPTIQYPSTAAEWRAAFAPYFGPHNNLPLLRCMEVVLATGAQTMVVERRYYDVDYRSEYSAYFSKLFASLPETTHRLHFFSSIIKAEDIGALADDAGYLGYVIVRPSQLGPVSRAMLKPPTLIADAIRAKVKEEISFFGDRLTVEGTPFAQQDTQFGACAHAAAWVCHYTAFLRGDVARRPRSEFSTLVNASLHPARAMPTSGLTVDQLSDLFRAMGLPAIFYALGELPDKRLPWQPTPPAAPQNGYPPDPAGKWDHGIIPILCRYLNSGLPVLVGTHDHAFVVCGYQRSSTNAGWIDFYRNDDQRGPYILIPDVLNDSGQTPWRTVHVPAPEKIWLGPEAAEFHGGRVLQRTSAALSPALTTFYGSPLETLDVLINAKRLALKTYVVRSNQFKAELTRRGVPREIARAYRLATFSRYVWVVEAIDRDLRDAGRSCVVGQAIFDATSSDMSPNLLALDVHGVTWSPSSNKPIVAATGPFLSGAVGPP
jgi:hypothetical protein